MTALWIISIVSLILSIICCMFLGSAVYITIQQKKTAKKQIENITSLFKDFNK